MGQQHGSPRWTDKSQPGLDTDLQQTSLPATKAPALLSLQLDSLIEEPVRPQLEWIRHCPGGQGEIAQLSERLPRMDGTMGSIPSTVAIPACHPGIWETDAGGSETQSHPLLHSKFEANLDYMRSCQERKGNKSKEVGVGEKERKGICSALNCRTPEGLRASECKQTPREMESNLNPAVDSVVGGANSHSGWEHTPATWKHITCRNYEFQEGPKGH